jgi:hypothetical protein
LSTEGLKEKIKELGFLNQDDTIVKETEYFLRKELTAKIF